MKLDRESMRGVFSSSALDYSIVTNLDIEKLRLMLADELESSGCFDNSFRVHSSCEVFKGKYADIKCSSSYFVSRQCLTFEEDGFIGFAGWADDKNIQPILRAFKKWIESYKT